MHLDLASVSRKSRHAVTHCLCCRPSHDGKCLAPLTRRVTRVTGPIRGAHNNGWGINNNLTSPSKTFHSVKICVKNNRITAHVPSLSHCHDYADWNYVPSEDNAEPLKTSCLETEG